MVLLTFRPKAVLVVFARFSILIFCLKNANEKSTGRGLLNQTNGLCWMPRLSHLQIRYRPARQLPQVREEGDGVHIDDGMMILPSGRAGLVMGTRLNILLAVFTSRARRHDCLSALTVKYKVAYAMTGIDCPWLMRPCFALSMG